MMQVHTIPQFGIAQGRRPSSSRSRTIFRGEAISTCYGLRTKSFFLKASSLRAVIGGIALIKTAHGPAWLTIPVEAKGRYLQAIDEDTDFGQSMGE